MSDVIEMIFILLVIFGPAAAILWARDRHRRRKLSKAGLLITDKTILSGTPPHQMGGKLSEQLRSYAKLPDTDWQECRVPDDLLNRAIAAAKAVEAFSVLCMERTEGTASRRKKDGIDLSWRMDGVRPARMHVSQAGWSPERRLYELDEWISLEDAAYMNPGIWFKLENPSVAGEYRQLNHDLLPETALYRLREKGIERTGMLHDEASTYYGLETTEVEEDSTITMQAWIEQGSMLIRKARHAVYENGALMAERISVFAGAPSGLTIQAPDGLENDTEESVAIPRVVEHW